MFKSRVTLFVFLTLCVSAHTLAQTVEESAEACSDAARLIQEGLLDEALDEANWCLEGLKQLKQAKTLAMLPDEVNGYLGGEVTSDSILGMTNIKREYTQDAQSVMVSMMAVEGDGGGFAAIAALGMSMGLAGKKYRIQKRTVIDNSALKGQAEFFVQLKSGGMINITSEMLAPEMVLEFIRDFPIKEIDTALGK